MTEKLIELINNSNDTNKKLELEDFLVKELVSGNGFMAFSKNEIYSSKEISEFNLKYLFDKYPY